MDVKELRNLSEAYNLVHQVDEVVEEEVEQLDEAEGSYGQTPQSTKRWNKATVSRMNKPASEYEKRGDKKKEVSKYSKHNQRTMALDADASRGPGKKSSRGSGGRLGYKMTQKDRDDSRGQSEYGHTGYDPDFDGPPSAPGGKPKGKKAERQKKTGVSAESFDIYGIILSHLLDEGYASTEQSADKIILNMSESWFEEILNERTRYAKETGKNVRTGRPSVEGGDPKVAERNKLPGYNYGGSKQEPKERGKKPPSPSEEAKKKGVLSPLEHKVALRRNARQRASDFRMDTRGT